MTSVRVRRPEPVLRDHLPLLGDERVRVTSRYLEIDGRPTIPVSAEVHFSRLPPETWERELARIRAGGVTVLATYAIWLHHERADATLDFAGQLDLRRFLTLCRAADLEIALRVGPFVHGETRNGGLPDRVVASGTRIRTDDPEYLALVEPWFTALGAEIAGIPLLAVQVENELYDQPDHLRTLAAMARRAGIDAPLWTATAWGGAQLPVDEVLPLYGGYPASFWIDSDDEVDERSRHNLVFDTERDDASIGADVRDAAPTTSNLDPTRYPYVTCELGGGMVSAYHRRLAVEARDVSALALVQLGSGSNWQGYYMFHDGRNPRPGLQESQASGFPNDLPEHDYDFGAPLALSGAPRASYDELAVQHRFLAAFGELLAPMTATVGGGDLNWAVRSDGDAAFVFVVNHMPETRMPAHDVELSIEFPDRTVALPPMRVEPGAVFVLPLGLELGGIRLDWATAQPLAWDAEARELTLLRVDGVVPRASVAGRELELDSGLTEFGPLRVLLVDQAVEGELEAEFETEVEVLGEASVAVHRAAGEAAPVRRGPSGRETVPTDWSPALVVDVGIEVAAAGQWLEIDWVGDVARVVVDGVVVADSFFSGRVWHVPFEGRRMRVEVLPIRADSTVHVPRSARSRMPMTGQAARVERILVKRFTQNHPRP